MFCPKCQSLMLPRREGNHKVLVCTNTKCNFKTKDAALATIKEKVAPQEKELEVVEKEEYTILPLTDAKCEKCGHRKAHYWTLQTRAGDEPETKFLKCEKCGHIWRDYS